jgi:hypothetical protein
MAGLTFTKKEKAKITLLVGGLTIAHDFFVEAGIRGLGYNVQMLECPTTRGSRSARSSATAASATRRTSRSATW